MRFGLPISLAMHAGLIAAGLLVLPVPKLTLIDTPEIVPVELVTLAEQTSVAAISPEPEPKPEVSEPLVTPPESLPEPVPEPEPKPEPIVVPPPKKVEPKPVKKEVAPKPKPKKQAKPRRKPKPKAPAFNLARLESKLAKQAPKDQPTEDVYERARAAIGTGDAMTANEIDLLRAQMYRCWRAPLDAPYPEKLKVTIRARLNPDGTLASAPEVLNAAQINRSGDPFWRAAADNARRAVLKCQPYALPPEKYALWRETIMHFSAADVLGN
jgi:outer membrane biosynthesis protein TonB